MAPPIPTSTSEDQGALSPIGGALNWALSNPLLALGIPLLSSALLRRNMTPSTLRSSLFPMWGNRSLMDPGRRVDDIISIIKQSGYMPNVQDMYMIPSSARQEIRSALLSLKDRYEAARGLSILDDNPTSSDILGFPNSPPSPSVGRFLRSFPGYRSDVKHVTERELSNVKDISLRPQINPDHPTASGLYYPDTKEIEIIPSNPYAPYILPHEVGHSIWSILPKQMRDRIEDLSDYGQDWIGNYPTSFSNVSDRVGENWAEAFALSRTVNPQKFLSDRGLPPTYSFSPKWRKTMGEYNAWMNFKPSTRVWGNDFPFLYLSPLEKEEFDIMKNITTRSGLEKLAYMRQFFQNRNRSPSLWKDDEILDWAQALEDLTK